MAHVDVGTSPRLILPSLHGFAASPMASKRHSAPYVMNSSPIVASQMRSSLKRRRADEYDEQEESQETQVRIYIVSVTRAYVNDLR